MHFLYFISYLYIDMKHIRTFMKKGFYRIKKRSFFPLINKKPSNILTVVWNIKNETFYPFIPLLLKLQTFNPFETSLEAPNQFISLFQDFPL